MLRFYKYLYIIKSKKYPLTTLSHNLDKKNPLKLAYIL